MKKIMFNERFGLEQAVLAGTKTMTRRIIKGNFEDVKAYHANGGWHFIADTDEGDSVELKPQYEIGERVVIAQSYKNLIEQGYLCRESDGWVSEKYCTSPGYRNKMFVKAEYMSHRIRITGIKAERLRDISDKEAMREGIRQSVVEYGDKKIVQWTYFGEKITTWFDSPRDAFAALIDRISGRGTWQCNPWVYAYTFELIK